MDFFSKDTLITVLAYGAAIGLGLGSVFNLVVAGTAAYQSEWKAAVLTAIVGIGCAAASQLVIALLTRQQ